MITSMFSLNISSITELFTLLVRFATSTILVVRISSNFFFSSLDKSAESELFEAAVVSLFLKAASEFTLNFSK